MSVDAIEDIGEVGLRIEPVHLGGFDQRHGAGRCFPTSVTSDEEPVFPTGADGAHCPFSSVVVDGNATILQEQDERVLISVEK